MDGAKKYRGNLDDMVVWVMAEFVAFDGTTAERIWASLFANYRAIMDVAGENTYYRPHTGVGKRQRNGFDAVDFSCTNESVLACRNMLTMYRNSLMQL